MPDRTTDSAGFFVVTVLIVLGWPLALVLLRNVLLYLGYMEWLKTLGEEVRGACGRRADLLSRRLEEEMGQRLSSKVLRAATQSKEFVSEKSTQLVSVVKNELLSSCDIETFSITHDTHDTCDSYPDPYSSDTSDEPASTEGVELVQFGIRQNQVFWGMRDYLLPGGVLVVPVPFLASRPSPTTSPTTSPTSALPPSPPYSPPLSDTPDGRGWWGGGGGWGWGVGWSKVQVRLPPGLAEDALFRLCNNIEPVSFVLSDPHHPQPIVARVIIYTAAQVIALYIYVTLYGIPLGPITLGSVVGVVLSPIVLLLQHWLHYMLLCPCLYTKDTPLCGRVGSGLLRALGGLLALPVTLLMLLLLFQISTTIAHGSHNILGLYIANAIIIAFLIALGLDSARFWWFAPKVRVQVCGYVLCEVNRWTLERERDEAERGSGTGAGAGAEVGAWAEAGGQADKAEDGVEDVEDGYMGYAGYAGGGWAAGGSVGECSDCEGGGRDRGGGGGRGRIIAHAQCATVDLCCCCCLSSGCRCRSSEVD